MSVRRAAPPDAEALGAIGPAAYAERYADLWDEPSAYADHLQSFGGPAFARLIARPDARVFVAEVAARPVGFLTMHLDVADPIRRAPNGAEIARIYLLGLARGRGLGWRLLDAALAEARVANRAYVWLDVMASATDARATYARWGFVDLGPHTFGGPVRAEEREMRVLARGV